MRCPAGFFSLLVSCAPPAVAPPASPAPPPTSIESPPAQVLRSDYLSPFDRGAAQTALEAVNVASCARPGGPTGPGRVALAFAVDGRVTSVRVDGAPYEGTLVGDCVAERFRGVRIPAFEGTPIAVIKRFRVE
jgi:hypothetical protein